MRIVLNKDIVTVREYLDLAGFDWKNGTVIYQHCSTEYPGIAPSSKLKTPEVISKFHEILDTPFNYNHVCPTFPRIFARDAEAVYFPVYVRGFSWLEKVPVSWLHYTKGEETPYIVI